MLAYTFLYDKAVYKISFEHSAYMAFLFSAILFLFFCSVIVLVDHEYTNAYDGQVETENIDSFHAPN